MLSILISVYNVDVRMLVRDLLQQARQLNIPFEIIVEDDASTNAYIKDANRGLTADTSVTYVQNEVNRGRAGVRNHLADAARYPNLLFIDGDAGMKRSNYVSTYVQYIRSHTQTMHPYAVLGGVGYRDMVVDPQYKLRWKFGVTREQKTAALRNMNPFRAFTPFNVLITKSVFDVCRFDESLKTYGFEDTLFGEMLEQQGVTVEHIDNELYHDGIDTNEVYLQKVESAVDNMAKLMRDGKITPAFENNFRLVKAYRQCEKLHVSGLVSFVLTLLRPLIMLEIKKFSSLLALDLYKLSRLIRQLR